VMAEARESQYLHELVRQLEAANVTGNVANTPQEVPGFRWFPGYSPAKGWSKERDGVEPCIRDLERGRQGTHTCYSRAAHRNQVYGIVMVRGRTFHSAFDLAPAVEISSVSRSIWSFRDSKRMGFARKESIPAARHSSRWLSVA
jgi:hypothetical protein